MNKTVIEGFAGSDAGMAERRGKLWRARWRAPDGTLEAKSGFRTRKAAENYGRDQEAAVRSNTYIDPKAGRITLTEWVNQWYPALDLELNTLRTYRYTIEVHILPAFGARPLATLTPEEIAMWEKQIAASGYTRRTAREARSTLTTILADAAGREARPSRRPGLLSCGITAGERGDSNPRHPGPQPGALTS
jgi:hypothetical protein